MSANQAKVNIIAEWVDNFASDMISWASYKLSDTELAKDIVQDTFLAAAEKIDSFKGDSSPKTWLYSIMNHKIIDHYRSKIKKPLSLDNSLFSTFFNNNGEWQQQNRPRDWNEDESHLLDDEGFNQVLQKCLGKLPEIWSTCVHMKYMMKKNGTEICQELDITPTNFWQIMHRAKLNLRDCIEKNWFNE